MLPLFKSHYSVGKSILTLDPPKAADASSTACSVFDICAKHNLESLILVEDSLVGFLEAQKRSTEVGVQLVFGLRISLCSDMSSKPAKYGVGEHKVIVFAKNGRGCSLLNRLYSLAQTKGSGRLDSKGLESLYNSEDLFIAIPFYDSFLFHNAFLHESSCILDHSFFSPVFFLENNFLPFDSCLREMAEAYATSFGFATQEVKSIYYENREDFEAYQTYKCICNRTPGRARSLDMPNLDHCGSSEFCFESYLENESA